MKRNLFLKILFSYLVIVSLSFFVLDLLIKDEIKKVMTSKIEAELLTYAELINLNSAQKISEQFRQIARITGSRVTLVDAQGKVLADSEKDVATMEDHFNRPELQEARLRGNGKSIRFSQSIGVDMLYVAIPIKSKAQITGYIRLARPLIDVQNAIEKVYQSIFLAMMIVAVIALIIALIFSYRLAAPIRAIEKFTERLRQGKPTGTIILYTSDETKKLADNINYLVDELKSKIRLANEEKSKLMTAFTSINEGVLILDAVDKIEFVSLALSNMLAAQYGDINGKTLMEAFRNIELEKIFHQFKESHQTVSREITLGSVEPVILKVSISAVQDHPEEEKTMIVFHDVTRLKKLEKIRIDFVANVTHEIRTPLTAIIGYLETIKDGAINNIDETKRFIEIILKQAQRLNRLVEDLMTISKIELNETRFNFENVFLSDAVTNVISIVEKKATSKKITMENDMPEKLRSVRADRDKLTQILVNVLDNAVKFTPESGKIIIAADETDAYSVISITDTGIGVPGDEIQRLGERFYRVDKTRSRDLGGTGLGLSIVKHLMIAHGGRMEIESQLGRGTKVSLFFPVVKV
ncbi:MAG: ATP-binding protein [Smithellaceae bacterium]|jgi:two-component system phosphate regulon sensor histidine kinase PhoR